MQIGRLFRHRQAEWDSHLIRKPQIENPSDWLEAVSEWPDPQGTSELGPEFAVASTDYAASLDPDSAIHDDPTRSQFS